MNWRARVQTQTSTTEIAPGIRTFLIVQVLLVFGCFATELFCKFVLHLHGPYVYPLRTRNQNCWDFTLFADQFKYFHRPEFFQIREFPYPAPVAVPYALFFSYHAHPLALFLAFIAASFLFAAAMLGLALRRCGITTLQTLTIVSVSLVLSYPLWFELKQGNIEIVVWVLVTLGIWAFCQGKNYTAAALFGIAGSMKIFPFVYLGLLLSRRKYIQTGFALVVGALSTTVSLWLVGPHIVNTWRQIQAGVDLFSKIYVLQFRPEEIGFDHTLFGIYKQLKWRHMPPVGVLSHRLAIYIAVSAFVGITLYFVRIRYLPLANQLLCLAIASILLPPISFDYTLMHLYAPWALLVLLAQRLAKTAKTIPGLIPAFLCFALLFSPESEFIRNGVHFGGQLKAIALVVLMGIALAYRFDSGAKPIPDI